MKLPLALIQFAVLTAAALCATTPKAQTTLQECVAQADTALENALCDLRSLSRSSNLPNMEDFKRNPPEIQHLLLKREAERYGLTLPGVSSSSKSEETSTTKENTHKNNPTKEKQRPSLAGCELDEDVIECQNTRYELVRNKKNNQLKAEAFSSHNQLIFAEKNASEFEEQSDYRYLSAMYPVYINKMLAIGLGDSTMSFTKFATLYWQTKHDENSFAERFRQIYNQLKIEKSRNQIKGRYTDTYPEDLTQCVRMDSKILICDNKHQNWVYKLR